MIKILIADDSKTETALLASLFNSQADMKVIGYAKNGKEAVELAALLKPDLITMDIHMPIMDGIEAIKLIMSQTPVPIVVISSRLDKETNITYDALDAGALSVLDKPAISKELRLENNKIIATIRSMSEIKVIKRRFFVPPKKTKTTQAVKLTGINRHFDLIAIGASAGGPQVLKFIFSKLPSNLAVPVVVVQHMTVGYIDGFATWLNNNCEITVKGVTDNEELKPSTVYLAPDNLHFEVKRTNGKLHAHLFNSTPISGFKPSITVLFNSVAATCGKNAVGLLLTGMGSDGAEGMLAMKKAKAHTLIQDSNSCVVFGMAGVAQSLGAVDKVVNLEEIGSYLISLVK